MDARFYFLQWTSVWIVVLLLISEPVLMFDDPLATVSPDKDFSLTTENCRYRDTCNANVSVDRGCSCNDLCGLYGDCCRHLGQQVIKQSRSRLPRNSIQCQFGGKKMTRYGTVWMVVDCPKNYMNQFVAEQCRLGQQNTSGTFFQLPVNGRPSRILYRNYYCALCNGETEVTYWNVTRACATLPIAMTGDIADCFIEFQHPSEDLKPINCTVGIDTCAKDWTGNRTENECRDPNGTLLVYDKYDKNVKVFRNKFCALCNHLPESNLACKPPDDGEHGSGVVDPVGPPPFSILLDLNSGGGTVYDNQVGSGNQVEIVRTISELRVCDEGEVYDPFSDTCRPIFCRPGYKMVDEKCFPITLEAVDGSSEVNYLSDCPLIRLNQTEYEILANGSALVIAVQTVYEPKEFQTTGDFIEICNPSFDRSYNFTRNVTDFVIMFKFDTVQGYLSFVGVMVSLVSLLVQFVIYMMFPVLRNTPGKCIICLIVALFFGLILLLFVTPRTDQFPGQACPYFGAAMHYAFLAAFFWMNVMAIDVFRTFSSSEVSRTSGRSQTKKFVVYSLYAWLVPATIVGLAVTMDLLRLDDMYRPHYGRNICWIASRMALIVFFAVPFGAILLANIILFALSVRHIQLASQASRAAVQKPDSTGQLALYVKLSFVMGLPWILGFFATIKDWTATWYLFIIFNSLQGAFVCFTFVCTKKVFRLLADMNKESISKRQTVGNGKYVVSSSSSSSKPKNHKAGNSTATTLLNENNIKVEVIESCL